MIVLRGHHLELLHSYLQVRDTPFLEGKKHRIIQTAIDEGHGRAHGENIVAVLEKVFEPRQKICFIDTIDDMCHTCDKKTTRKCREFIPYDISAASADRARSSLRMASLPASRTQLGNPRGELRADRGGQRVSGKAPVSVRHRNGGGVHPPFPL